MSDISPREAANTGRAGNGNGASVAVAIDMCIGSLALSASPLS